MTNDLKIRTATPEDAEALLDLYVHLTSDDTRCVPEHARNAITAITSYEGSAVLVGDVAGVILTSCTLIVIPNLTRGGRPYALVENVVTHTDQRGQGYAKRILDHATERAWDHGCYKVMLSTGSRNPVTLGFYEKAGFEQSRTGFQKRRIAARRD